MDLSENYISGNRKRSERKFQSLAKIRRSVGSELTSQLKPFRPAMKRLLNKRGYNTSGMSFNDMIPVYYNECVSNKNIAKSNYVPINCFEFSENPVFKFSEHDNLNGDIFTHENRAYFNKVAAVTDTIIDDFRGAKLRYKHFKIPNSNNFDINLTNDDIVKGKAAVKVENDLKIKADGAKPVTVKQLMIVGLVIVLFIYLSK